MLKLIKSSPESRDACMEYFATVLKLNQDRGKIHLQNPQAVSTDGFMINLFAVLLKLCVPLMDMEYSKLHLID